MLNKFTLALFTLTLNAFFSSATVQENLPEDTRVGRTAGQGDDYLASFLIANASDSSGTPSQTNFKRSHVMRRMNTPGGEGRSKEIVVPLHKSISHTRYVGRIHAGPNLRERFDVAFGTAAFDLAVITDQVPRSQSDKSIPGRKHRYAKVFGDSIRVNLFDGFGTGVACQDKVGVGGISQESRMFGTLQVVEGFTASRTAQGVFPLARTDHSQFRPDQTKSFINQAIEEHMIEPVFAFAHRSSLNKGREGQGELHLGMMKDDYITRDKLESHDCVADSPFWTIDKATITIGTYKVKNARTIFDSASRLVRGPKEEVSKIYQSIKSNKNLDYERLESGIYVGYHKNLKSIVPKVTFQWGNGKEWSITQEKFLQGSGPLPDYTKKYVGLFAEHTKFTAAPKPLPIMEPPLPPHVMGPPHSNGLKPLEKGPLPPLWHKEAGAKGQLPPPAPAVKGPQDKKAIAWNERVQLPEVQVPQSQIMPEETEWIIPYPFFEDKYIIFDRRKGECKVMITMLPPEKLKVES